MRPPTFLKIVELLGTQDRKTGPDRRRVICEAPSLQLCREESLPAEKRLTVLAQAQPPVLQAPTYYKVCVTTYFQPAAPETSANW